MSDFNISYSLGSPPTATQQDTTLWSFNSTELLPSAGNLVIAQPKRGGPGVLLQQEVAHALSQCRQFRTLDAHLKQIVAAMPPLREHMDDTRQTLKQFTENGLLESSEQAWERLTTGAPERPLATCSLCILTCDRPDALKRLLSHLSEIPHEVDRLWVIDDSRSPDSQAANAEAIAEYASSCPVPVHHCDLSLREKLITQLKASAPSAADSIDWLLNRAQWDGVATYGQARNLALVLNVGRRILMLDDDILPIAVAPPLASTQLTFSRGNDSDAVLWKSKDEMEAQALPLAASPLSMMLKSLGAPLGTLASLKELRHNSLEGTDGELVGTFQGSSPILVGQCGYWGDTGTGDGMWLSHMPYTTIKRALEAHADLEAVMGARAAWSGHRGPSLTPFAVKSAQTGVDHTGLLPPYFPIGRGEDLFFGILTQRLHPQSIVHNEGWAIRHEPVDSRNERIPMAPMSVRPGIKVLLDWLGREPNDQWGLTPERRLRGVAEQVWRLTEMDATALDTLVRQELASKRGAQLRQCMDSLGHFTTLEHLPGFPQWREFVEQSRDALVAEIQEPEPAPLSEWIAGSKTLSYDSLRQGGAAFAKALEDWPEICEAAQGFEP